MEGREGRRDSKEQSRGKQSVDVMHAAKPPAPPVGGQLLGHLRPCLQLLLIRQSMPIKDTPLKRGMLAEQRVDIGGIMKLCKQCDVRVM